MSNTIRRVEYYHATVRDQPGEAYQMLQQIAELGINLLAFTAVPVGPDRTQLTIFPEDARNLIKLAEQSGLQLEGPHHAILVQGADELGSLAEVHKKIYQAGVNVYASSGVSAGEDAYGYLLYLRPEAFERAAEALGI